MTTRLTEPSWIVRALARARSLEGKPWTEREQEVIDAYKKHEEALGEFEGWAVFMAYGVRPEKQSYVNGTVELLEEAAACEDIKDRRGKLLSAWVRLGWSCEMLIGGKNDIF